MNCEEFVELISTYLDAVMDPRHAALFLQHLRGCPPCAVCLEQFMLTVRILAMVPSPARLAGERREDLVAAFRAARG